jgi:hypothetical protein
MAPQFGNTQGNLQKKILAGLFILLLFLLMGASYKIFFQKESLRGQLKLKIHENLDMLVDLKKLSNSSDEKDDAMLALEEYNEELKEIFHKVKIGKITETGAQEELNAIKEKTDLIMKEFKLIPKNRDIKTSDLADPIYIDKDKKIIKDLRKTVYEQDKDLLEKDNQIKILKKINKRLVLENKSLLKTIASLEKTQDDKIKQINTLKENLQVAYSKQDVDNLNEQIAKLKKDTSDRGQLIRENSQNLADKAEEFNIASLELDKRTRELSTAKSQVTSNYSELVKKLRSRANIQIYAYDKKGRKCVFFDQKGKETLEKNVSFKDLDRFFISITQIGESTPAKIEHWDFYLETVEKNKRKNNKRKLATVPLVKKAGSPLIEGEAQIMKERLKELRKIGRKTFRFSLTKKGKTMTTNEFKL